MLFGQGLGTLSVNQVPQLGAFLTNPFLGRAPLLKQATEKEKITSGSLILSSLLEDLVKRAHPRRILSHSRESDFPFDKLLGEL